jgi:hypothetical protein
MTTKDPRFLKLSKISNSLLEIRSSLKEIKKAKICTFWFKDRQQLKKFSKKESQHKK